MPRKAATSKVVYVAVPQKKKYAKKVAKPLNSKAMILKGHGDYTYDNPGPFGRHGREIGSALGEYFGGEKGSKLGSKLGSYLHYIGKIFGSGDYITSADQVKSNTLINEAQIPAFSHGKNTVRIKHREYLGDILSSSVAGAFKIQQFSINPGIDESFPWLSQVCGSTFQQYRINGMVFEFRSMSADALNSTNTALGTVVMATDYDSKDVPFTSKAQMENTEFGVSCKPSSCMIHGIECARNQTSVNELYIRARSVPTGADVRLYDMGNFYIATQGCQAANVNLGELWVSYDVTLFKAIQQVPGYLSLMANYDLTGATGTKPLELSSTYVSQPRYDTIGLTLTDTEIIFPLTIPKGSVWQVLWCSRGASGGISTPGMTNSGGMLDKYCAINDFSAGYASGSVTGTTIMSLNYFEYNGTGTDAVPPKITFSSYTPTAAPIQGGNLYVTMLPGDLPGDAI